MRISQRAGAVSPALPEATLASLTETEQYAGAEGRCGRIRGFEGAARQRGADGQHQVGDLAWLDDVDDLAPARRQGEHDHAAHQQDRAQ